MTLTQLLFFLLVVLGFAYLAFVRCHLDYFFYAFLGGVIYSLPLIFGYGLFYVNEGKNLETALIPLSLEVYLIYGSLLVSIIFFSIFFKPKNNPKKHVSHLPCQKKAFAFFVLFHVVAFLYFSQDYFSIVAGADGDKVALRAQFREQLEPTWSLWVYAAIVGFSISIIFRSPIAFWFLFSLLLQSYTGQRTELAFALISGLLAYCSINQVKSTQLRKRPFVAVLVFSVSAASFFGMVNFGGLYGDLQRGDWSRAPKLVSPVAAFERLKTAEMAIVAGMTEKTIREDFRSGDVRNLIGSALSFVPFGRTVVDLNYDRYYQRAHERWAPLAERWHLAHSIFAVSYWLLGVVGLFLPSVYIAGVGFIYQQITVRASPVFVAGLTPIAGLTAIYIYRNDWVQMASFTRNIGVIFLFYFFIFLVLRVFHEATVKPSRSGGCPVL